MGYKEFIDKILESQEPFHMKFRFGFLEAVHDFSVIIESPKSFASSGSEREIKVFYGGDILGQFTAIISIHDVITMELKHINKRMNVHDIQLLEELTRLVKEAHS